MHEQAAFPPYPRFLPVGDSAVSVEFGNAIDPALNAAVVSLDLSVAAAEIPGIVETMPTFRSLLVCYDPGETSYDQLVQSLSGLVARPLANPAGSGRRWTVPVAYGGAYGDDLDEAAGALGMTPDEVIETHCAAEYLVYLVGFHPGTPNLGGLPSRLHISRRKLPRPSAPPSSVAIGGMQSGITSIPSPTGWYVLGRTPVRPYQPGRANPFLFQPGDRVRFRPITPGEFERLDAQARIRQDVAVLDGLP